MKTDVKLTEDEERQLREKGYEILERLGEGQQREAYLARYQSGGVSKTRVLTISKPEVNPESVCSVMVRCKGRNLDEAEVDISNQVQHVNVVEVLDNFCLNNGNGKRNVNVQAYHEATDLESLVKMTGPLKDDEKGRNIIKQLLEGADYLESQGFVHRDYKPANVLVTRDGNVKVSDLHIAAKRSWDLGSHMPTMGSIPYSHPKFINSFFSGCPESASRETEAYSVAATILYAVSGEKPFSYRFVRENDGKEVKIGDQVFKIGLKDGDELVEKITVEEHEERLNRVLRKAPKSLRKMLRRALSMKTSKKKRIGSVGQLKREFKKAQRGVFGRFADGIAFGARYILPSAVAAGVAGLCIYGGIVQSGKERKPTMADVLRGVDYRNFSLENILEGPDRNYVLDVIVPCMEDARERLPKLEAFDKSRISLGTEHSHVVLRLNKRLVSSWLRACYLSRYQKRLMGEGNDRRLAPSFVPFDFALISGSGIMRTPDVATDLTKIALGAQYLKLCLGPKRNVADVLADYISSKEVINTAIARTESISYFPRIVSEGEHGGRIEVGYRRFLPPAEQEFVDMATALYAITDEDGQVHWDRIPRLNFVPGTYSRLTIPSR